MATKRKHKTNQGMLKHVMNFSRNGILMECFIMERLQTSAEQITQHPKEEWVARQEAGKDGKGKVISFINWSAYYDCAVEFLEELKVLRG